MSGVKSTFVNVTTTGTAGTATGTADSEVINGFITKIALNYHASAPATTDTTITVSASSNGGLLENIYVVTNTVTDVVVYPRTVGCTTAGVAIATTTIPYECIGINGVVTIALAQSDALTDALVAQIFWESVD